MKKLLIISGLALAAGCQTVDKAFEANVASDEFGTLVFCQVDLAKVANHEDGFLAGLKAIPGKAWGSYKNSMVEHPVLTPLVTLAAGLTASDALGSYGWSEAADDIFGGGGSSRKSGPPPPDPNCEHLVQEGDGNSINLHGESLSSCVHITQRGSNNKFSRGDLVSEE